MNRCENAVFLEREAHCQKGLFEKRQLLTILFEALHVVHLARDPPFLSIGMLSWPSSFCACPVLGNPRRNYSRIAEDFVIVFIVSGRTSVVVGSSKQEMSRARTNASKSSSVPQPASMMVRSLSRMPTE